MMLTKERNKGNEPLQNVSPKSMKCIYTFAFFNIFSFSMKL